MSRNLCRIVLVLLVVTVLASAAWLQPAQGQKVRGGPVFKDAAPKGQFPGGMPTPPAGSTTGNNPDGFEYGGISLPKDEKRLNTKIEAATEYIEQGDWTEAIPLLQNLIEIKEDVFARLQRKSPDGKDIYVWKSVKSEADRLIATLPPNGRDFYKVKFNHLAADLLKKYKQTGDPALLAEIMKRYAHTDPGGEAINLLASYHLDRGNYSVAVRCYDKLLNREGADKLPPAVLFKAAYAAHLAGAADNSSGTQIASDKINEKDLWKQLRERTRELTFSNGESRSVSELEEYVAKLERPSFSLDATDSPVFRSTPSRSNQLVGGAAFLVPRFEKVKLLHDDKGAAAHHLHTAAEKGFTENHQAPLTAFSPITVTVTKGEQKLPLLLYKDYWGINAFNMKTGKLEWESPSSWSLERMLGPRADAKKQQAMTQWLQFYQTQGVRPQILFENSTVNSLSTDGKYAYVVEDLAVPPPPTVNVNMGWNPGMQAMNAYGPEIQDAISHSRLQAFNLVTGKLSWEAGEKGLLSDCYFLGPPLPLGGKLYLLAEKQQELRLLCLETVDDPDPKKPAQVHLVSSQILGTTHNKMDQEVMRRTQAAHLAYGEGILVCPTNAGAVFGINLLENSLLWAYPYREKSDQSADLGPQFRRQPGLPPGMVIGPGGRIMPAPQAHPQQGEWKVSAPVVQDGKVVFTAPDSRSIHCINLRDGSPVWSKKKLDEDLYLGNVCNGKVLIVGKKSVRLLSLSSGETLRTLETGLPSGQGIASDHLYYLPLKEAGRAKEPEICAIDMERGEIFAHTKSRAKVGDKSREVPGNLLFYEGDVISQTPWEIVAYPQLKVKMAQMDDLIARNPNDPLGLTERGELRLDKGDLAGAIEDLSLALKNKPDAETRDKARAKLYDTLTEFIQKNFNEAEKYLPEYEELCNVDPTGVTDEKVKAERLAEQQRRKATFLWLVAQGRENQGRLVEAFEKYQEFGAVAGKQQELVPAVDESAVKAAPDVWSRGRIIAMMARATPEHRAPLEKLINARWDKLRQTNDLDELRRFVRLFGPVTAAGKEARLQLAERLIDHNDKDALLEAELELSSFRTGKESPELAARATEVLARLYTRKGLLEDAAYCYRKLGTEYGRIQIRDGKTGRDFFNDTATDKRLLPHLDEPEHVGGAGKIGIKTETGPFRMSPRDGNAQVFQFEHSGEALPFFHRYALGLRLDNNELKLIDRSSGERREERWHKTITRTMFGNLAGHNTVRFSYRSLGHLVVLPVAEKVFGINADTGEIKWEYDLSTSSHAVQTPLRQVVPDPRDNTVQLIYVDGWAQRLGQVGPLEGKAVCVQTREALTALDPLTGRTLWSRTDVNPRHNVLFADADHVYVVELGNDNTPQATRVFRAADGISVKAPDFAALYQKRVQLFGSNLLLQETGPANTVTLRLYEPLTGQDLWKQTYPSRSLVVRSEDSSLTGVVEPDGKVHVINLRARKEVMAGQMSDPKELLNVQTIHLLADSKYFYLACCAPPQDVRINQFGGLQSNLLPNSGLRSLPVNGMVYWFERDTGEVMWTKVENQMLVLDQFQDLPVLLFTSRYQKVGMVGFRQQVRQVTSLLSIDKRTVKVLYEDKEGSKGSNFYAINVDARAGRIDFVSFNFKLTHLLNSNEPDKAAKPAAPKSTPTPVGAAGPSRLRRVQVEAANPFPR